MSRDKQMINDLIEIFDEEYGKRNLITPQNTAEKLTAKGYRKASEVAREIFEEIEELLIRLADESKLLRDKEINLDEKTQLNGEWIGVRLALRDISELKKKYTEMEKDNGI